MIGPGKYDDVCALVRKKTKARAVIVIVIDGDSGSGMSCKADLATMLMLPGLLEDIARQIRAGKT